MYPTYPLYPQYPLKLYPHRLLPLMLFSKFLFYVILSIKALNIYFGSLAMEVILCRKQLHYQPIIQEM